VPESTATGGGRVVVVVVVVDVLEDEVDVPDAEVVEVPARFDARSRLSESLQPPSTVVAAKSESAKRRVRNREKSKS
jgi:hypothetical protein